MPFDQGHRIFEAVADPFQHLSELRWVLAQREGSLVRRLGPGRHQLGQTLGVRRTKPLQVSGWDVVLVMHFQNVDLMLVQSFLDVLDAKCLVFMHQL